MEENLTITEACESRINSLSEKTLTPIEIAAQIWCEPQHEKKVLDPDLAFSIAERIAIQHEEIKRLKLELVRSIKNSEEWRLHYWRIADEQKQPKKETEKTNQEW